MTAKKQPRKLGTGDVKVKPRRKYQVTLAQQGFSNSSSSEPPAAPKPK